MAKRFGVVVEVLLEVGGTDDQSWAEEYAVTRFKMAAEQSIFFDVDSPMSVTVEEVGAVSSAERIGA